MVSKVHGNEPVQITKYVTSAGELDITEDIVNIMTLAVAPQHMSTVCMLWSGWNRVYCFRPFVIVTNFCLFFCKVSSLRAFKMLQENNSGSSGI